MITDGLNPAEDLRPAFDTIDRKPIDIIVPVYKSVQLTIRAGSASFTLLDMNLKAHQGANLNGRAASGVPATDKAVRSLASFSRDEKQMES